MKIYTDGATSNNGYDDAVGGWAYAIITDDEQHPIRVDCGRIENATNNICELTAIIKACNAATNIGGHFIIYSDSAYCINCYKQKWYKKWQQNGWLNSKKESVANRELWEQLIPFFENSLYEFEKVKGHDTNSKNQNSYWNNYVDKLAVAAKENKLNG